ncbi:ralA-binding protein 1-A-like isoform X2 [Tigriopus californicus]|uniref:ralA-binding protein 1-A-like isoform X2 n=1 Tax=Tigriopus californicus TaxID=6832 RepID=UPI0027DA70D7|nr:ralA-binding protein 1-A-like isoform X2 [Tigriopus californicus]
MSDEEQVSPGEDTSEESRRTAKKEKGLVILKKEKKEKKSKEKETRYAHLGEDSSGNDEPDGKSPAKAKRSKPFILGSAKKDKDKKKEVKEGKESSSETKKKDKKEKPMMKWTKSLKQAETDTEIVVECPIFGVPLELATQRHKSHDGVPLPVIVRQCVDFVEEHGLMQEGIYRSAGVKSKQAKLRNTFNARQPVVLNDYEPAVVAGVLKQFLREIPEPILTPALMPKFEKVSCESSAQKRIEGMRQLLNSLPECNRTLVQYIFVHMSHVIERERFNKMTLQNVSIVLSPTMQISHRVLNCFFENAHILFDGVQIKKYIPPILAEPGSQGQNIPLPETAQDIEDEIKKQESLLQDLHLQISSGAASKKTEEQIWEQQRIVTQLKRKLRLVKKQTDGTMDPDRPKFQPIDYDEELNFSLQTPAHLKATTEKDNHDDDKVDGHVEPTETTVTEPTPPKPTLQEVDPLPPPANLTPETPETKEDIEHKVTVMIHRSSESTDQSLEEPTKQAALEPVEEPTLPVERKSSLVTVIKLGQDPEISTKKTTPSPPNSENPPDEPPTTHTSVTFKIPAKLDGPSFPILPPPPASNKMRVGYTQVLRPTPAVPVQKKPMLPSMSVDRGVEMAKSKSLPRGLPSDASMFEEFSDDGGGSNEGPQSLNPFPIEKAQTIISREQELEDLYVEELRVKFEFEELMGLKSELERRKRSEKKEMSELKEELASMHTLYQYRTCSVDSSESSSDEGSDKEGKEEIEELGKIYTDLIRENRELEEKRQALYQKIQEERAACVNLRVEIRVEQERRRMRKRANDLML